MVRMRLATLALVVSLAGTTLLAHATFNPRMNLWRLEQEVRALRDIGEPVDVVAITALRARVEAGKVTAAMVISGYTPLSVVRAMLEAGAMPVPVCAGLLVAGVRIEDAREYFKLSMTAVPKACPPTLVSSGSSPSDVTADFSASGSSTPIATSTSTPTTDVTPGVGGSGGGGGGPIGSLN